MNITIDDTACGLTIKQLLYKMGISRGLITKMKAAPMGITVNGEHATVRRVLALGDVLYLAAEDTNEDENEHLVPTKMPLDIIYEDGDIIAVNKPYDMATHPSIGHFEDTLANGLAYYFADKGVPFVFRAVNRLDRDTSGVVLVAKNRPAAARLSECLQAGNIKKRYIAVLNGILLPMQGRIDAPIRRRDGTIMLRETCDITAVGAKSALTEYETLFSSHEGTVVRACPVTGRTHQLRVHFLGMGCPIAGDGFYGTAETVPTRLDKMMTRQALHAESLTIRLDGKTLTLSAKLPPDMERLVLRIKESIEFE